MLYDVLLLGNSYFPLWSRAGRSHVSNSAGLTCFSTNLLCAPCFSNLRTCHDFTTRGPTLVAQSTDLTSVIYGDNVDDREVLSDITLTLWIPKCKSDSVNVYGYCLLRQYYITHRWYQNLLGKWMFEKAPLYWDKPCVLRNSNTNSTVLLMAVFKPHEDYSPKSLVMVSVWSMVC
jgi:hypothetical protein